MFMPPFAAPWHRPQEMFGAMRQPVGSGLPPSFLPTGGGAHAPLPMPGPDSFQPLANKAPNMAAASQWYANRPPPVPSGGAGMPLGSPGASFMGSAGPDYTQGMGGLPGSPGGPGQASGGYASPFGKG